MTEPSDYAIWLVAQRLKTLILDAGGRAVGVELRYGAHPGVDGLGAPTFFQSNISMHAARYDLTPEEREVTAAHLLDTVQGAKLWRHDGRMTIYGQWSNGVTYYLWGGEGVCERVQVGTQKVLRPAPDAPMIEVEEPIFEVRCPDPITQEVYA